jgi:D-glycero-D-manno-heptose 1,7-bisphosphate phosphatase
MMVDDGRPAQRQGGVLRPAVFLDRDGVINENLEGTYVRDWASFRFLPGAIDAIARLNRSGLPVVVVTNQAGIGRGVMTEAALDAIHARMRTALASGGAFVDAVRYCPHTPDDGCDCRKPRPGMLRRAAAELDLDLARSVFVGDHLTDAQAAAAAGCRPLLVCTGRGANLADAIRTDPVLAHVAVAVVADLPAAVDAILAGT